ncbi:MAG TPA: HAMP domain-containing sensor histidine kinase [Stenomitos sp.]
MGNYLIMLLPILVLLIASRVVARYGAEFDVPEYPVSRLRLMSSVAVYLSLGATALWWDQPGIHATWSLATLGLFAFSHEANLRLVDSPFTWRRWWLPYAVAALSLAAWIGATHPNPLALGVWAVWAVLMQAASIGVLVTSHLRSSPAVLIIVSAYVAGLLVEVATPWVVLRPSHHMVELMLVLVALSAILMAMGMLCFVLERTAQRLTVTQGRISVEIDERTAELRAANARLQELDRLKDQILSTVSHELRTPLATIRGYGEFLEDEIAGPLSEGNREFVGNILEATQVVSHKVDDLLDLAGISAGNFRFEFMPFRYDELLRQLGSLMHPILARRSQALRLQHPDDIQLVGDRRRIQQVLVNLVQNASKFSPDGTTIEVHVAVGADGITTQVMDQGIGIPPEQLSRIFEAFYQVDSHSTRVHGGIGMGLAIVRSMIEAHRGRIEVRSQEQEGSTFQFWLPFLPFEERRVPTAQLPEATS